MIYRLLLTISLCVAVTPLHAQQSAPEDPGRDVTSADNPGNVRQAVASEPGSFPLSLFTEGLWSRYSSNVIPDTALAEALNVVIDEDVDGVVVTRKGRGLCASSPIEDTKSVRSQVQFNASDGTKYHVAVTSTSIWQHSGNCTWEIIPGFDGWDASLPVDLLSYLGKLWATDGTKLVWWDGSSTQPVSGAPLGTRIDGFRNRILMINVSGNQSRVYMSGELDGEDWALPNITVSTSPIIISIGGVNDGDNITCEMGAYGDVYFFGKRDSLFGLYGFDATNFQIREISREVGCLEPDSVREKNNKLYWLSKRGVERMSGPNIMRVSDQVRDLVDTIIATAGSPRSHIDSTQSEWEEGDLEGAGPGAPMSSTINPGQIVGSTFSAVDTSSTNFSLGTLSNLSLTDIIDSVVLSSTVFEDDFSDGNLTTDPVWSIVSGGGIQIVGGGVTGTGSNTISYSSSPVVYSTGSWSFRHRYNDDQDLDCAGFVDQLCLEFKFVKDGDDYYSLELFENGINTNDGVTAKLTKFDSSESNIATTNISTYSGGTNRVWLIERNDAGQINVYLDGNPIFLMVDTAITESDGVELGLYNDSGASIVNTVNSIYSFSYHGNGQIISRIFDTGFSTPTTGILSSTSTPLPADEGNVAFYTRSSTSPNNDLWSSYASSSDTLKLTEMNDRYWQYKAEFNTTIATKTPTLDAISLRAGTTAQYIASCINTFGMSEYRTLGCTKIDYEGSWLLEVSTGSSCQDVQVATATWNTHTNGATVSISTAAYTGFRLTNSFSLFVATGNPSVSSCQLNWLEGESRPAVVAEVYQDRYHLSYTSSTDAGATNSHQLILDRNDKWVLWDNIPCASLTIYERNLYCGDSGDTGLVFQQDTGTDDNGSAFVSRIKTKSFNMGMPARRKAFEDLFLDLEPEPDPADSISVTARYYVDRGTVPVSLGTVDLGEDGKHLLTAEFNFPVDSEMTASKYIQLELESDGINQPWRLFGGRLYYKPLSKE